LCKTEMNMGWVGSTHGWVRLDCVWV